MPVPDPKKVAGVSISSMGVLDQIVTKVHDLGLIGSGGDGGIEGEGRGKLQVHRPWVTGDELTNGLGIFLGTFDGVLELSCVYNKACHDIHGVRDFLASLEFLVEGWVEGGGMDPGDDLGWGVEGFLMHD